MGQISLINSHFHDQPIANDTWDITHHLGTITPCVDVWIVVAGNITKIIPHNVNVVDPNTISITFNSAFAGHATVV